MRTEQAEGEILEVTFKTETLPPCDIPKKQQRAAKKSIKSENEIL